MKHPINTAIAFRPIAVLNGDFMLNLWLTERFGQWYRLGEKFPRHRSNGVSWMIQWILYSIHFWPEAASAISWSGGIPKVRYRIASMEQGDVAISASGPD